MSLIEYKVSQEQIDKGLAQLNAANPQYNYKTDSILGMAANTNIPLGILAAIFDIATIGIFEFIRYAYVNHNNHSYEQLCADFAKRQFDIQSKEQAKTPVTLDIKKAQREVFSELRGRITKAGDAPKANADHIRLAAQYKLEQAICQAGGLKNDDDSFDSEVVTVATKASADLVSSVEDNGMRSGVSGLRSGGFSNIDDEAIKEVADEHGKKTDDVERELGKQLRMQYPNTTQGKRDFAKAIRAPKVAETNKHVEEKIKKATAELKTQVAARQKCIGELHRIETELDKLRENLEDIRADLGTEETEEDNATGYYLDRDNAQKALDREPKGKALTRAQNAFDEADEKIKELEKKKEEIESSCTKLITAETKQKEALAKVETKYGKLIAKHFDIGSVEDSATSRRLRDDKVVKAIAIAGTRDEDSETEEGKLKFHALPADLSKHFDKKGLKQVEQRAHGPKIRNIAKIRDDEIARNEAEKLVKKGKELSEDKKLELDYFGKVVAKANAKVLKQLAGRRGISETEGSDSDDSASEVENEGRVHDARRGRPINLEEAGDGQPVDDENADNNVDNNEPPSRASKLSRWKQNLQRNQDNNNQDNNN